jgi:hypothetical protein
LRNSLHAANSEHLLDKLFHRADVKLSCLAGLCSLAWPRKSGPNRG